MTKPIIILEDLRFDFTETQLARVAMYWNTYSETSSNTIEKVKQIAEDVQLSVDNTFLVILHLQREGRI